MIKSISTAVAVSAVVTFIGVCSQASAQSCSSCAPVGSFSYPAPQAGCAHGGCRLGHGHHGGHVENFKNQLKHQSTINSKITARNDAWPKPFSCWDKQDYYQTWNVMLNTGSENFAVLDRNFFTDQNDLNRIGIDRVAGIVMNLPASERTVFVSRTTDQAVDQARVDAIQEMVATYYSHRGAVDVRLSDKLPQTAAAADKLAIYQGRNEQRPPAILPVGEADTVNAAVTQ